ncbi:MAG: NAD(P)H-dependent oxidoreductase subunit E [Acidimicrobiales bacterium]
MADLHLTDDAPSDAERQAIDDVIDAEHLDGSGSAITIETERIVRAGTQRAAGLRHLLLPSLHALQRASGWISPGGLNHIAERLQVPPAEAYGVATFYDLFRFEAPTHDGPTMHVCVDAACQIAGAAEQIEYLEAEGVHVHPSPCLGQCERAVGVFVQRRAGDADPEPADTNEPVIPQQYDPALRLLRRVDRYDPASLEGYVGVGGFKALGAAMRLGASGVIDAVTASGLKGRGGAAFPTGIKWQAVAGEQADQKYLVV